MGGTAALLIDLENFFIGREDQHRRDHGDEAYEFPIDLDSLCQFAAALAGDRRLVVSRAYANFNDRRPGDGDRRWDYYLQPQPRFLMEQGIEPVQVFRFPGGSNKNAADMRLAMDATALISGRAPVDLFVIVTGDSDFIPLVLELKRSGAEVVVIGVTGCTKPIFARYCDRFEYFEDLLAAREMEKDSSSTLAPIRDALASLLVRTSPIKFAAVKPLLTDELGYPFDPSQFRCESTGDFLRRNSETLGIGVRKGAHDWEIEERSEDPDAEYSRDPEDSAEDDAPDSIPSGSTEGLSRDGYASSGAAHTAEAYSDLLRQGTPRCYVPSPDDWATIVDAILDVATDDSGERTEVIHGELLDEVTGLCMDRGLHEATRKVRDVMFHLFKAGCFRCVEKGTTDFHWSLPARIDTEIDGRSGITRCAWAFLIDLLRRRIEQRGIRGPLEVEPLFELFVGVDGTEADREMIEDLIDESLPEREESPAEAIVD